MRIRAMAVLCFAATFPLQGQPTPPPEIVLQQVLSLDSGQVAAIQTLMQTRRAAAEPVRVQIEATQQALATALAGETADPAEVGKLLLTIRDLQRQFETQQRAHVQSFLNVLTEEQKARVGHIQSVEAALHAAQALHQLGL